MSYNIITRGCVIETLWDFELEDGTIVREWLSGVVKKVHRYDDSKSYVVCTFKYDDGKTDKSRIFREEEYDVFWRFPREYALQTQNENTKITDILTTTKHLKSINYFILFCNMILIYYMISYEICFDIIQAYDGVRKYTINNTIVKKFIEMKDQGIYKVF